MNYKDYIASIQDFPSEGILFRDITPLMQNGEVFKAACKDIVAFAKEVNADVVVGPESRGFIFGCPVAYELGIDTTDIKNCYLKAESPIALLKGDKTLAEFGIRNGSVINYTD